MTVSIQNTLNELADYHRILVAGITYEDLASYPGISTSVFLQGCNIHCDGCFNPEAWGVDNGTEWKPDELYNTIIKKDPLSTQIVWLGGEPTLQCRNILPVVKRFYGKRQQILFTGLTLEQLERKIQHDSYVKDVITCMSVVKVGPYEKKLYSSDLLYRGSANQKFYRVKLIDGMLNFIEMSDDDLTSK